MTTRKPPFTIPNGLMGVKVRPDGLWESRTFPDENSDGDSSKWPKIAGYRPSDNRNYLIRLAHAWARRDPTYKEGTNYYLDELPAGYGTFEMDQPSGNQVYKRLFGHPSGKFYDSILKFEPHFLWLLDGRHGICTCVNCGNVKQVPGPPRMRVKQDIIERPTRVPKPALRQDHPRLQTEISTDGDTSSRAESMNEFARHRERRNRNTENLPPVDEEGTFDVYKDALTRLYNQRDSAKGRDLDLFEKGSIDWTAERSALQEHLTQIDLQHAFIPRRGELVLWCVSIPDEHNIYRDQDGHYKLFSLRKKRFTGYPRWRAGVVAAVPTASSKNGTVDFADILETPDKQMALNTAGFRIETVPDPNDNRDKSLTKQYRYVPLQNIRPLSFWKFVLFGIPESELHQSIFNALTCMTAISIVEKTKLVGHWHEETYINAKGCFLGPELITVGDAVRLSPASLQGQCTEILVVDSIRLQLQGLRESYLNNESQLLCKSSEIHFVGRAFTIDKTTAFIAPTQTEPQALSKDEIIPTFRPVGTAKYGNWYPLHDMSKEYEVSHDQVLGRLYEADAISLWSGKYQQKRDRDDPGKFRPDLGLDYEGLLFGRRYATKADERIPDLPPDEPNGIRWILSDYRAQALAVQTINGREVAPYHDIRSKPTLQDWRYMTSIHNGETPMIEAAAVTKKRPNYNVTAAFDGQLDFSQDSSRGGDTGKTRGRPPGSKLIDGKIYTHEQLVALNIKQATSNGLSNQVEVANLDDDDEDEILEQESGRQAPLRSSQMASARMNDADEDLIDEEEENFDADEDMVPDLPRRSFKSRLAMYGSDDEDEDAVDATMEDIEPVMKHSEKPAPRSALKKFEIMESVEDDEVDALDADDYESEDEDGYLDMWKAPQNARGGTEESEGGDYRPGESQ